MNNNNGKQIFIIDKHEDSASETLVTKVMDSRIQLITETLASKGTEYGVSNNRMHNFDRASFLKNKKPYRILEGFVLKHDVSYLDIMDKLDAGKSVSIEQIREKMGDIINYMILQEALLIRQAVENNITNDAGYDWKHNLQIK